MAYETDADVITRDGDGYSLNVAGADAVAGPNNSIKADIVETDRVAAIQRAIGVEPSGQWDATTNEAFALWLRIEQAKTMGVENSDGWWGTGSAKALEGKMDPEAFAALQELSTSGKLNQLAWRTSVHNASFESLARAAGADATEGFVVTPFVMPKPRPGVPLVEGELIDAPVGNRLTYSSIIDAEFTVVEPPAALPPPARALPAPPQGPALPAPRAALPAPSEANAPRLQSRILTGEIVPAEGVPENLKPVRVSVNGQEMAPIRPKVRVVAEPAPRAVPRTGPSVESSAPPSPPRAIQGEIVSADEVPEGLKQAGRSSVRSTGTGAPSSAPTGSGGAAPVAEPPVIKTNLPVVQAPSSIPPVPPPPPSAPPVVVEPPSGGNLPVPKPDAPPPAIRNGGPIEVPVADVGNVSPKLITASRVIKGAGVVGVVVSVGVGVHETYEGNKAGDGHKVARAVGGTAGGIGASMVAGAAAGAAIGVWAGGIGAVPAAIIGAGVAGVAGYFGYKFGAKAADAVAGDAAQRGYDKPFEKALAGLSQGWKSRLDKDGNGKVNANEMRAFYSEYGVTNSDLAAGAVRGRGGITSQAGKFALDVDGRDGITAAELQASLDRMSKTVKVADQPFEAARKGLSAGLVKKLDSNHDGVASGAEIRAAAARYGISAEEMQAKPEYRGRAGTKNANGFNTDGKAGLSTAELEAGLNKMFSKAPPVNQHFTTAADPKATAREIALDRRQFDGLNATQIIGKLDASTKTSSEVKWHGQTMKFTDALKDPAFVRGTLSYFEGQQASGKQDCSVEIAALRELQERQGGHSVATVVPGAAR